MGDASLRTVKAKIRTVDAFLRHIEVNYDRPRNYHQLKAEISNLAQRPHESMDSYIARVEELAYEIHNQLPTAKVRNRAAAKESIDDDLTAGFVRGLQKKYLKLIRTDMFNCLAEAFEEGRYAEQRIMDYPQLSDGPSNQKKCYLAEATIAEDPDSG